MKTIYKYPLKITNVQQIQYTPNSGEFDCLKVGLDPNGNPCIWAVANTKEEPKLIKIFVVGTGNPLPNDADYHLGSFNQNMFVWHVFAKN